MLITIITFQRLQQVSLIAVLLTLLLAATASAALVNRKISGVMPAFGDAEYSQINPDGPFLNQKLPILIKQLTIYPNLTTTTHVTDHIPMHG